MAARKNSVAHTLIHISPNFISSDLFHPGLVKKLPRCRTPRRKSDHWGKDKTHYGGIGNLGTLPPLGDVVEPNTARSHRHYGSGLQNFSLDRKVQDPIQIKITHAPDLALSNKVMHDPYLTQDLFSSHISKFDVFPRFDPRRNEFDDPSKRNLLEEIGPATIKDLDELSNLIYRQSEYQRTFTHPHPEDIAKIRLQKLRELLAAEEIAAQEIERINSKSLEGADDNEEEEETDEDKKIEKDQKTKTNFENLTTIDDTSLPSLVENKELLNQSNRVQLLTNKLPIQPLKLKPISIQQQQTKQVSAKQFALAMPKVTDFGKRRIRFDQQDIPIPSVEALKDSRRLSALRGGDLSLLTYRRKKFPAMLGMTFKNDAHIRYHRNHLESIPDLRDSITAGKQHWFNGVHASLLR